MNQLHLTDGWSPQVQLAVESDSTIAEKNGALFVPLLPAPKRKEKSPKPSLAPKPDPQLTSQRKALEPGRR